MQYSEGVKGLSPLLLACISGNQSCVELLLKKGATAKSEEFVNMSPLHAAIYSNNSDCLRFLADQFDILLLLIYSFILFFRIIDLIM